MAPWASRSARRVKQTQVAATISHSPCLTCWHRVCAMEFDRWSRRQSVHSKDNAAPICQMKIAAGGWNLDGTWMEPGWNLHGTWMVPGWNLDGTWMEPGWNLDGAQSVVSVFRSMKKFCVRKNFLPLAEIRYHTLGSIQVPSRFHPGSIQVPSRFHPGSMATGPWIYTLDVHFGRAPEEVPRRAPGKVPLSPPYSTLRGDTDCANA